MRRHQREGLRRDELAEMASRRDRGASKRFRRLNHVAWLRGVLSRSAPHRACASLLTNCHEYLRSARECERPRLP